MTSPIELRRRYREGLDSIPEHMRDQLTGYIEGGRKPSYFLECLLCFPLAAEDPWAYADAINVAARDKWAIYMRDHMPRIACGSKTKFDAWLKLRGLSGMEDASVK